MHVKSKRKEVPSSETDPSLLCHLEMLVDKPPVSFDRQLLYFGIMKSGAQQQLRKKKKDESCLSLSCPDTAVTAEPLDVCLGGTDEEIHLDNGNWTLNYGG